MPVEIRVRKLARYFIFYHQQIYWAIRNIAFPALVRYDLDLSPNLSPKRREVWNFSPFPLREGG